MANDIKSRISSIKVIKRQFLELLVPRKEISAKHFWETKKTIFPLLDFLQKKAALTIKGEEIAGVGNPQRVRHHFGLAQFINKLEPIFWIFFFPLIKKKKNEASQFSTLTTFSLFQGLCFQGLCFRGLRFRGLRSVVCISRSVFSRHSRVESSFSTAPAPSRFSPKN